MVLATAQCPAEELPVPATGPLLRSAALAC